MGLLLCLIYGLISGITEFLPVSSQAHQLLFLEIFGIDQRLPILDLCVHIGMLAAVYYTNHSVMSRIQRERRLSKTRRKQSPTGDSAARYDSRLIKSATVIMLVLLLLKLITSTYTFDSVRLSIFLLLNAVIILIPEYMRHGNKDSRSMASLDGLLIGFFSAFSVFSGISRVGSGVSYAVARGADRQHAINWAMLLSIPALLLYILFDIISLITIGTGVMSFGVVIGSILALATAFVGSYLAIMGLRFISDRAGFSGFAYYSIGAALFTFGIYLLT